MNADLETLYPKITFYDRPVPVSMADHWYEFSTPDHFWVKRRFRVMDRMIRGLIRNDSTSWLDVGCGSGLLQQHCRRRFKIKVKGADLNLNALKLNQSGGDLTLCYNIHSRRPELREAFDIVSALDVIEHIDDAGNFIDSILFHVKPGGIVLINVPAHQAFYSRYDHVAGHLRRYSARDLVAIGNTHKLQLARWSYWGLPLIPLLIARNLVAHFTPHERVIQRGFSTPSSFVNAILDVISELEWLPNYLTGTSILAVFRKDR